MTHYYHQDPLISASLSMSIKYHHQSSFGIDITIVNQFSNIYKAQTSIFIRQYPVSTFATSQFHHKCPFNFSITLVSSPVKILLLGPKPLKIHDPSAYSTNLRPNLMYNTGNKQIIFSLQHLCALTVSGFHCLLSVW